MMGASLTECKNVPASSREGVDPMSKLARISSVVLAMVAIAALVAALAPGRVAHGAQTSATTPMAGMEMDMGTPTASAPSNDAMSRMFQDCMSMMNMMMAMMNGGMPGMTGTPVAAASGMEGTPDNGMGGMAMPTTTTQP